MSLEIKNFFREISELCLRRGMLSYEANYELDYYGKYGRVRSVFILSVEHKNGYSTEGYYHVKLDRIGFHAGQPLPRRSFASCTCVMFDGFASLDSYSRGQGFTYIEKLDDVLEGLKL